MRKVKVERFTASQQVFVEFKPDYKCISVYLYTIVDPEMNGNIIFQRLNDNNGFIFQYACDKLCYNMRIDTDLSGKTKSEKSKFFTELISKSLIKEAAYSVHYDRKAVIYQHAILK